MSVESVEIKPQVTVEMPLLKTEKKDPPGDIKFIGWDKDGTFLHQDFSNIIAQLLETEFNVPYNRSRTLLDQGFNRGVLLKNMIAALLPEVSKEIQTLTVKVARQKMRDGQPVLFDDAYPTLYKLNKEGYRMFVVTRDHSIKARSQIKFLAEMHGGDRYPGLDKLFEAIVGRKYKKGEPAFKCAAEIMGVSYEEFRDHLLYIGNDVFDGETSKKARIKGFFARNSYVGTPQSLGNRIDLYRAGSADRVFDNLYEVPGIIPVYWPKKVKL